jgi:hypothetical protein
MSATRSTLLCIMTALSAASGFAGTVGNAGTTREASAGAGEPNAMRPLPFFYDLYTFRGRDGRTAVVSAFAVEAGKLETERADSRARYRFSVTLVLVDTVRRSVTDTHDTVYVDVQRPLDDEHLLYTHIVLPAPPSGAIRHRVIMTDATTPGIGQLYSEHFLIPDYSGKGLMLSDIAFGNPGAVTGWERGDVTLALLPTSQFPSRPFDVYYEIYNLPAGHRYGTEIAIQQVRDEDARPRPDREPVRLRFSGESTATSDGTLPELRRVESALPPGTYRLTVTITNLTTGQRASRSRRMEVHEWNRGATMVAAHPGTDRGAIR